MPSELMAAVESLGRRLGVDDRTIISVSNPGPDKSWVRDRFTTGSLAIGQHRPRREGDEWACACGARWGVGETAPAGHHGH